MVIKLPLKKPAPESESKIQSSYERFKLLYMEKLEKSLITIFKEGWSINLGVIRTLGLLACPYILIGIFSSESLLYTGSPPHSLPPPLRIAVELIRWGLSSSTSIAINVFFFIYIIYLGYRLYQKHKSFVKKYKRYVIEPIIKVINPSFKYFPEKHISENDYLESGLFRNHEHFKGDDLITGTIEDFEFTMSEVHTYYHSGHGKNRTRHNIFDGLFFVFKYKKYLQFYTCIHPDFAERLLGKLFGQKLQSLISSDKHGELVKLENPDFEKIFKVTSTDQIESRTILTPVMMEKMVRFYEEVGQKPIYFAFKKNIVYVGISKALNNRSISPNQFFEPPSFLIMPQKASFNFAKNIYDTVNIPVEIAKEINDNASVWKK